MTAYSTLEKGVLSFVLIFRHAAVISEQVAAAFLRPNSVSILFEIIKN